MLITRDPNETPKVPNEMFEQAERMGMHVITVICESQEHKDGINFAAIVPAIPRIGERILLEGKSVAQVTMVHWKMVVLRGDDGKATTIYMAPHVLAVVPEGPLEWPGVE